MSKLVLDNKGKAVVKVFLWAFTLTFMICLTAFGVSMVVRTLGLEIDGWQKYVLPVAVAFLTFMLDWAIMRFVVKKLRKKVVA
jgi:hypothetical protein